jgi:hypothetical protein
MPLRLALFAPLLLSVADHTLLTRDGRRLHGRVSVSGQTVVVEGASGRVEIPAERVLVVYGQPKEAVSRADALYAQAKRAFEDAKALPERDARRNERLQAAIDILSLARDIYEALTRYHDGEDWAFLSKSLSNAMQLMRLCRDQKGSELAVEAATAPERVPLVSGDYAFQAPPSRLGPRVELKDDLGAGSLAAVRQLEADDPRARVEAARRLASPPAPHAVPAILARLERETHDEVLKTLVETLALFDLSAAPKSMGWVRKVSGGPKRVLLTALLKHIGDRGACELLVEWLVETPPQDDRVRAAICSAFRKMRETAHKELRDAMARTKDRRAQGEILKQMGVMGDKRNAATLLQSLPGFKTHAVVGLIDLGGPAIPKVCEGIRSADADYKKYCTYVARRVTGLDRQNAADFEQWYQTSRKSLEEAEEAFWAEQAAKDYPVDPRSFNPYERRIEEIIRQ